MFQAHLACLSFKGGDRNASWVCDLETIMFVNSRKLFMIYDQISKTERSMSTWNNRFLFQLLYQLSYEKGRLLSLHLNSLTIRIHVYLAHYFHLDSDSSLQSLMLRQQPLAAGLRQRWVIFRQSSILSVFKANIGFCRINRDSIPMTIGLPPVQQSIRNYWLLWSQNIGNHFRGKYEEDGNGNKLNEPG